MSKRWIVLVALVGAFEWALVALGELLGDVSVAEALVSAAVLVILGNGCGLLLIAGIKWAQRGDR